MGTGTFLAWAGGAENPVKPALTASSRAKLLSILAREQLPQNHLSLHLPHVPASYRDGFSFIQQTVL